MWNVNTKLHTKKQKNPKKTLQIKNSMKDAKKLEDQHEKILEAGYGWKMREVSV